jgi:hypothetical protein
MRLLLCHPGASWSTHDVFEGLRYGLEHHGVDVYEYRLDARIEIASKALHAQARMARKRNPEMPKPTKADVFYQAACGSLERALRLQVDAVVVVSAMYFHPDVLTLMKRAGLKVFVLFTESPYDIDQEVAIAKIVDGCWTNERSSVPTFRAVNPKSGYLPHAWHPVKHRIDTPIPENVPGHDVVFVGTGFPDRITFFNSIDWTGIDLGLYGTWKGMGLKKQVAACVRDEQVNNEYAAALYRKAKIGVNLYRAFAGWGRTARRVTGDSLSPRAYELAACGAFHISAFRSEVPEVFGDLVPTFTAPTEAAALIRTWLADAAGRARVAAQLPACVAECSWVERSTRVIGDLQTLIASHRPTEMVCT